MVNAAEKDSGQDSPISIDEHSAHLGLKTPQLDPAERVKFWLAKWVLLFGAMLMLVAWAIRISIIWGLPDIGECGSGAEARTPDCKYALTLLENRTTAADGIFEFAKTWIPPVITLVLGYYFARETANQNNSDDG